METLSYQQSVSRTRAEGSRSQEDPANHVDLFFSLCSGIDIVTPHTRVSCGDGTMRSLGVVVVS